MTIPQHHSQKPRDMTRHIPAHKNRVAVLICAMLFLPASLVAQTADPTEIKRKFLDRYLDCAEAPSAEARLTCYDMLLVDIPAWLDEPSDPLYVSYQQPTQDMRHKTLAKKQE